VQQLALPDLPGEKTLHECVRRGKDEHPRDGTVLVRFLRHRRGMKTRQLHAVRVRHVQLVGIILRVEDFLGEPDQAFEITVSRADVISRINNLLPSLRTFRFHHKVEMILTDIVANREET